MTFALVLVITAVLSVALAGAIRKVPVVFYALAIAAVLILFAGSYGFVSGAWWKPLILLVKRCMVALALFTVVMFTGALPDDSWLGKRLRTARAQLSIIAWILCLGHMCPYLVLYGERLFAGGLNGNLLVSFIVAVVLFVLLFVLGVTSFAAVKKRMGATAWKRVQRFAYLFFLLVYVHLILILLPSAMTGGRAAIESVIVYSVIFIAYVVARVIRWRLDAKKAKLEEAE